MYCYVACIIILKKQVLKKILLIDHKYAITPVV